MFTAQEVAAIRMALCHLMKTVDDARLVVSISDKLAKLENVGNSKIKKLDKKIESREVRSAPMSGGPVIPLPGDEEN